MTILLPEGPTDELEALYCHPVVAGGSAAVCGNTVPNHDVCVWSNEPITRLFYTHSK